MTLMSLLGIDESEADWRMFGRCRGFEIQGESEDQELYDPFFDTYESDVFVRQAVDAMCSDCPVRTECLRYGVSRNEEGVWGGHYLTSNGTLHKNNSSHRTKEQVQSAEQEIKEVRDALR